MADLKTCFSAAFKGINIAQLIGDALEENADAINDLNRQQLDRGLDAKGKNLGRYKNFKYKGRYQPVDLKKKGEFRDKFTLTANVKKKEAEMFSQDRKDVFLTKKYGKDVHGVPRENYSNVEDYIKPDLQASFEKAVLSNAV